MGERPWRRGLDSKSLRSSRQSNERRASSLKRIRKLRWMGMQREAEALQARCAGASEALIACWRHRLMPLSLDTDQRSKPRDPSSQTGMLRGGHYGTDVLVRAGRLLGDAAGRGAADQNPFRREVVDDLAPAPALEGGVA